MKENFFLEIWNFVFLPNPNSKFRKKNFEIFFFDFEVSNLPGITKSQKVHKVLFLVKDKKSKSTNSQDFSKRYLL